MHDCKMMFVLAAVLSSVAAPEWARAVAINCTKTVAPGQSIQSVLYKAKAGDVICVRPGTYYETLSIGASGTADAPIVIRGDGGRPVIDGQYRLPIENGMDYSKPRLGCPGVIDGKLPDGSPSRMRFECTGYYPLVRIAGSYITFEGFEVTRSSGAGITANGKSARTNVTIRNNYVHSVRDNGIFLWQVNYALVEHNEVADAQNFAPFWRNGFALVWGVGVGAYASHFVTFKGNLIHDNWGDGLLVDINKGGSTDITIESNILYQNFSTNGVYAHAVKRLSMRRNLIYCPTGTVVESSASLLAAPTESHYSEDIDTEDITVTNNIFAGCKKTALLLWNTKSPRLIVGITFVNNTIYDNGRAISIRGFGDGFLKKALFNKNLFIKTESSDFDFGSSANLFLGSAEEAGLLGADGKGSLPAVLKAGAVQPQWFRLKHYAGFGADLSGFIKAGLLSD
jgi:hypothetical protein